MRNSIFPFALWGLAGTLQNFSWAFSLPVKNVTDAIYPVSVPQHMRYYLERIVLQIFIIFALTCNALSYSTYNI